MKLSLLALVALAAIMLLDTAAEAQNYPSCALYERLPSDPKNCGFLTFEQCLVTVRGIDDYASKIIPISPRPDLTRRRKLKNDILIELVFAKWRLKLHDIRRDPPCLLSSAVKMVSPGVVMIMGDPGEFAFNAAPLKARG